MGTIKNAVYKVDNGTDFDEIHFKTKAEQVICSNGKTAEVKLAEKANKYINVLIPTLLNGWVNLNTGYETMKYFKDDFRVVHIQGLLTMGTGTYMFKLPEGYRPSEEMIFTVASLDVNNIWTSSQVSIKNTGEVNKITGINGKTHSLSISFLASV